MIKKTILVMICGILSIWTLSKTYDYLGPILKYGALYQSQQENNLLREEIKRLEHELNEKRRAIEHECNEKIRAYEHKCNEEIRNIKHECNEKIRAYEHKCNEEIRNIKHECNEKIRDLKLENSMLKLENKMINERVKDLEEKIEKKNALINYLQINLSKILAAYFMKNKEELDNVIEKIIKDFEEFKIKEMSFDLVQPIIDISKKQPEEPSRDA